MNTATRWSMAVGGAVLLLFGGSYVFAKRAKIRITLNSVIPNLKSRVVTSARSTYGRVAKASDNFVHTERDSQVPTT